MRILLVVTGLPSKKTPARSVFNLATAKYLSVEHAVTILYLRTLSPNRPIVIKNQVEGIDCIELSCLIPKTLKFLNLPLSILSINIFKRRISDILDKIDLIHVVGGNIATVSSYCFHKTRDIPYLVQLIGSDVHFYLPKYKDSNNLITPLRNASYLCFNSVELRNQFNSHVKINVPQFVIYRGVNMKEFKYNFVYNKKLHFLYLGGFRNKNANLKGGVTLLNSLKIINKEKLKVPIIVTIAGPDSDRFKHFSNTITNPKLKINFLGSISREKVKQELYNSHIVLIPSLYEGLPNVAFEAMASGNMVIGTHVGGIPELVEDQVTGLLVSPNCPEALAEKIIFSTENLEFVKFAALNGYKRMAKFSHQNFLLQYNSLYLQMLPHRTF